MPEERFELLAKNYETEQAELKQKVEALKSSLRRPRKATAVLQSSYRWYEVIPK